MRISKLVCMLFIASVTIQAKPAAGRPTLRIGLGLGSQTTQPFVVGSVGVGTASLGVSTPIRGPMRGSLDCNFSGGLPLGARIPEASNAGKQSLFTVIGALELARPSSQTGPSLSAGLGLGHSSISDARGPTNSPNHGFVPLAGRTALAFELRAGYTFGFGPGPTRLGLSSLGHGLLLDATSTSAYATSFGMSLQY